MYASRRGLRLLTRHRLFLVAVAVLTLLFLFHGRKARPSDPLAEDETTPHFLYPSRFRDHPDLEYETKISNALQGIERAVLAEHGGNDGAADRVWQIAKDADHRGPDSMTFEQRNDEWKYSLVTDEEATEFITKVLSAVPEIAKAYTSYPHYVLRTDLLRYLLLWYYGGFYADMDVFPARAIKSCPDLQPLFASGSAGKSNISLVVGVEIDEPYSSPRRMREWRWTRIYGFMQYTMYAPRRFSPILRETIARAIAYTKQHNDRYISRIFGPKYDQKTILGVTGPDVFTEAILDMLSSTLPSTHRLVDLSVDADAGIGDLVSKVTGDTQRRVTWAPFHKIRESLCIDAAEAAPETPMGGLCVLPISAWGNGQRHSGSEGFNSPHACVNHRFGGSWKKSFWGGLFT